MYLFCMAIAIVLLVVTWLLCCLAALPLVDLPLLFQQLLFNHTTGLFHSSKQLGYFMQLTTGLFVMLGSSLTRWHEHNWVIS